MDKHWHDPSNEGSQLPPQVLSQLAQEPLQLALQVPLHEASHVGHPGQVHCV
jgi:hypothetical protein